MVADRILLMGGQPGRIVREWQVQIPHPRQADSAAVITLRMEILAALLGLRAPVVPDGVQHDARPTYERAM